MLYDAFLDLMIEKGYEAITIQDIIDEANIGRSTFYSHFYDKEQLLLGCIDQLREFLKQQSIDRSLTEITGKDQFEFSLGMLQHVRSHEKMYKATVKKKGGAIVLQHMQQMLTDLAKDEIMMHLKNSSSSIIPQGIAVEFVVNTFLSLLTWWLDGNMHCSAEEIDRIFHKLTLSGLS
jgi:AcrR family transcriptional regulator